MSSEQLNAVLVERVVLPVWSRAILVKYDRALSQGLHKWLNLAQQLEDARAGRGAGTRGANKLRPCRERGVPQK